MSTACYPEAIRRVLLSEGGYVNHPSDPGGPTNFGITLAVYQQNGHPGATAADVRAMAIEEARRIYKLKYANPVRFDEDPAGLDYTLFDYAVNSGVSRANKVVRRVCALPDSADWPTLSIALSKRDSKALISAVNDERLRFLQSLKTWPTFGKGWGKRVQSVNAAALKMATLGDAPIPSVMPPVPDAPAPGKGEVPEPKVVKNVIIGGPAAGGASAGASWTDWFAAHPVETGLIVVVIVIAVGAAIYAVNRWREHKQDAPTPGLIPVPELKAA